MNGVFASYGDPNEGHCQARLAIITSIFQQICVCETDDELNLDIYFNNDCKDTYEGSCFKKYGKRIGYCSHRQCLKGVYSCECSRSLSEILKSDDLDSDTCDISEVKFIVKNFFVGQSKIPTAPWSMIVVGKTKFLLISCHSPEGARISQIPLNSILYVSNGLVHLLSPSSNMQSSKEILDCIKSWTEGQDCDITFSNLENIMRLKLGLKESEPSESLNYSLVGEQDSLCMNQHICINIDSTAKPRGYLTAYNIFSQASREYAILSNPNFKPNEINIFLSQVWKKLSAEKRKHYNELSAIDKARYLKEVATYNSNCSTQQAIKPKLKSPPHFKFDENSKLKSTQEDSKFLTSYNHFVQQETDYLKATTGQFDLGHVRKRWRSMSVDERCLYHSLESNDNLGSEDDSLPDHPENQPQLLADTRLSDIA